MTAAHTMSDLPVLIVGAGISGLVLAQHLQQLGVRFEIFDRDSAVDARSGGWGLTLHWALPVLRDLLPDRLVKRFPETFVNKDASSRGDVGSFQFFNLKTGEALYSVPAEERIRVNRGRLRELLTSGIDIHVSSQFDRVSCHLELLIFIYSVEQNTSRHRIRFRFHHCSVRRRYFIHRQTLGRLRRSAIVRSPDLIPR